MRKFLIRSRPSEKDSERHFRTDHLTANLGGHTARGGAVMIVGQGIKFVINMGATIVLARLLTPQDYGLIGMVTVVTGFILLFKNMGLSAATLQKPEINFSQVSTLFWINVVFGVATTAVTIAVAPMIAGFYGEHRLTWITVALGIGTVFSGLTVQHEALLKRQMRFLAIAMIDTISVFFGVSTAIVMARKGAGYWALVGGQLATAGVYASGVWLACDWRPGLPARNSGVRSMLAFGRNVTSYNVLNYFSRNLDNLLIGRVWGAQQLGLYAKAYQLLLLPIEQLSAPLDSVALASLSRLVDSPDRYRNVYLRMLEKVAMVSMPGVAFMIGTSDWLVRLMLGPQWDETGKIFAILGIIGLVEPITYAAGWLLISQGRTRDLVRWGIFDGSIAIVSILIGLPWGAIGVATSYSLIGFCIRKQLLFWFVGRSGPVRARDLYRAIAPSACATLSVLAALFLFRREVEISSPLLGLISGFLISSGMALITFCLLPAGRTALKDTKALISNLRR